MSEDSSNRSRAIGSGMVLGIGLGAAWGMLMATQLGGDVGVGISMGAGAGLVIALISGAAVYRVATS